MSRLGKEFELLVRDLEELYAGSSVEVRSPELITGRRSGTEREVDITLRSNVGTTPVLIAIECRDRGSRQDVTWIEQLATKRNDIGAHKMIAVSRSGFTEAASEAAASYGIETRTLRDVLPVEKFDWLEARDLTPCFINTRLAGISVEVAFLPEGGFDLSLPSGEVPLDHPVFFRKSDGTSAAIKDLIDQRWLSALALGIPMDELHRVRCSLKTYRPDDTISLKTASGSIDITRIDLDIEVFRTQGSTTPVSRMYEYVSEDSRVLAQGFDIRVPDGEGSTKLAFHKSTEGQRIIVRLTRDAISRRARRRSPIFWYQAPDSENRPG